MMKRLMAETTFKLEQKGFTLIEILMVILLVGIMIAVALPQFIDFSTEAKDRATKESLAVLRSGINTQYAQMRLRCGVTDSSWPAVADINANDVTTGGSTCTTTHVSNTSDRKFFAGDEPPENPWSATAATAAQRRTITACTGGTSCVADGNPAGEVDCVDGAAHDAASYGWCYDATTGQIWANTSNNGGTAGTDTENMF